MWLRGAIKFVVIRRGNVRKQIKLAMKIVFVSLPENKRANIYLNFRDLSLGLGLFYVRGKCVNIQIIAQEYKRLIGKQYVVGIENGETINLTFTDKDFYHLIGFQKFKGASIVKMIEDSAYNKKKFFKEVLAGNITFYETKVRLKNMDRYCVDGKWIELCDVEADKNITLVLNNRMPYFSYDNVNYLIKGELVALFDKNKAPSWRKLDADKIFFRFLEDEQRNLNFFIRKKENVNREYPVSFFLEEIKDEYLRAQSGRGEFIQKRVQVMYRAIYDNGTQLQDFVIFWDKIRFYYSKYVFEELFKGQKRLQEFFSSGTVVSSMAVRQLLESKNEMLNDVIQRLNKLEGEYNFKLKIDLYNKIEDEEAKELKAIEIIEEYEFDIENESVNVQTESMEDIEKNIRRLKEQITVLKNQIKKINKFLPVLCMLEREEVIYAYSEFLPEIKWYENEFVEHLISNMKIKEKNISPKQIKKAYETYKCK